MKLGQVKKKKLWFQSCWTKVFTTLFCQDVVYEGFLGCLLKDKVNDISIHTCCGNDKTIILEICIYTSPINNHTFYPCTPQALAGELGPFLCSGSHVIQKDCHPSAIHSFVEAMCQCLPNIPIRPCILKVSPRVMKCPSVSAGASIQMYMAGYN